MVAICFETSRATPLSLLERRNIGRPYDVGGALGTLYQGLLGGRFVVVESSVTDELASLTLRRATGPLTLLPRVASQGFDAVIRGELQKVWAIDSGLSPSSVATLLRQVMLNMNLSESFTRVPLALPLLAHAVTRPDLVAAYVEGNPEHASYVIRLKRPENVFLQRLTRCEYEVTRRYLEGRSYLQISSARSTSVRTIANQMSSAFKKLGASGRFGVLERAVRAKYGLAPRLTQIRDPSFEKSAEAASAKGTSGGSSLMSLVP